MKTAPAGKEFYFCDGVVVNTIPKLVEHIKKLSPEQYGCHVNSEKNDFFNWVNECIDKKVAKEIQGTPSQKDIIEKLTGYHWHQQHKKKHKY